jgi:hypothetical protein
VPRAQWARRYAQINAFEKKVAACGTTIVKVMLHISKDEQKARLAERLANPEKHWKFNPGDIDERAPLGRLHGGLPGRPGEVLHRGCALVCRARRQEVVCPAGRHESPPRRH